MKLTDPINLNYEFLLDKLIKEVKQSLPTYFSTEISLLFLLLERETSD